MGEATAFHASSMTSTLRFGHHGRGNGFPCLLDDKHLAVLLDTHLLDENVHDNKRHQWKQQWIILNGINLKDDEGLIKERRIQILVQGTLMTASPI